MAWFEQGAKGKRVAGKEIESSEASHRTGRLVVKCRRRVTNKVQTGRAR